MTEKPLPTPTLDHVVINARDHMDEAAACYRRLGFQLTPRGRHTLGSINHLAIFGTDYLELIGIEPEVETARVDIQRSPLGLNGLVFGTEDSLRLHSALKASGVAVGEPVEFSRPVEMAAGTGPFPRSAACARRGAVWPDLFLPPLHPPSGLAR